MLSSGLERVRRAMLLLGLLSGCGARPQATEVAPASPNGSAAAPEEAPTLPTIVMPDPTAAAAAPVGGEDLRWPAAATGAGALAALEKAHRDARAEDPDSEEGHAFVMRRVGGEGEVRRLVHCTRAEVLAQRRGGSLPRLAGALRQLEVPEEAWVVLVDPRGIAPGALGLSWYRHLAKHHRLQYLGTREGGVAIYRYEAPRPPLGR